MKVYRLIPDSFLSLDRQKNVIGLNETENISVEDIYYNMGYVTFNKRMYYVDLEACEIDQILLKEEHAGIKDTSKYGKFFFIFKEDPIIYSSNLSILCNYKPYYYRSGSGRLVEYDIPEDIVMRYYASGTYGPVCGYCSHELAAECYVKDNSFDGKIISSNEISIEDKRKALIKSLKQTLNSLTDLNNKDNKIYKYFTNLFNINEVINDDDKLKEVLFNSIYYENFIKKEVELVKTPYITGKVLSSPFDGALNYRFAKDNEDYYKARGFNVDFSYEHRRFREKMARYNSSEMDEEKKKYVLEMIRKQKELQL